MIGVNFLGLLYCTHYALPLMRDGGGGDVINLSSVAGRVASLGTGVYNMTKWGVVGYSESLRQEGVHIGIRVTVVEPGFVETELQGHNKNPIVVERRASKVPRERRQGAGGGRHRQRDRLRREPAGARQHQRDPRPPGVLSPLTVAELETERLLLRGLRVEDAAALFEVYSDPEVMRYWSSPPHADAARTREVLAEIIAEVERGDALQWALERRADRRVIGSITVMPEAGQPRAEIGYILGREHSGPGLCGRGPAARDRLRVRRASACTGSRPTPTRTTRRRPARCERAGASRREGLLRERWLVGGRFSDSVVWGLLMDDWRERRSRGLSIRSSVITYGAVAAGRFAYSSGRPPGAGAAGGNGAVATRPRGAQRCLGADALPGRARRDQPDAGDRRTNRRRPRFDPVQLLRLDETRARGGDSDGRAARAEARRSPRAEELTPPLPGQRADVSLHALEPGASTARPGDPPLAQAGSPRNRRRARREPGADD